MYLMTLSVTQTMEHVRWLDGSEPWIEDAEGSTLGLVEGLSKNGMGVLKKTMRNIRLESVITEIRRENFGNKLYNRYNLSKVEW